ncbi:hypothetical protein PMIN01_00567 [Paraphaeosphaeria minitans]|uniref:Uncharacterized protein n=1 Tax=Paraphaeosphaeria minitans TaxID=565426 RepID=A0A9P6GTM0_9PLEO|nr:hypothetical protein PMIN01_00567 [Paraphaeosphaeria minitans]
MGLDRHGSLIPGGGRGTQREQQHEGHTRMELDAWLTAVCIGPTSAHFDSITAAEAQCVVGRVVLTASLQEDDPWFSFPLAVQWLGRGGSRRPHGEATRISTGKDGRRRRECRGWESGCGGVGVGWRHVHGRRRALWRPRRRLRDAACMHGGHSPTPTHTAHGWQGRAAARPTNFRIARRSLTRAVSLGACVRSAVYSACLPAHCITKLRRRSPNVAAGHQTSPLVTKSRRWVTVCATHAELDLHRIAPSAPDFLASHLPSPTSHLPRAIAVRRLR